MQFVPNRSPSISQGFAHSGEQANDDCSPRRIPETQNLGQARRRSTVFLLTDDNELFEKACSYFRDHGLTVLTSGNPDDAEQRFLHCYGIGVWIIDVQALGPEAVYFAMQIQRFRPDCPILVVEGTRPDQHTLKRLMLPEWSLMSKPIELPSLLAATQALAQGHCGP